MLSGGNFPSYTVEWFFFVVHYSSPCYRWPSERPHSLVAFFFFYLCSNSASLYWFTYWVNKDEYDVIFAFFEHTIYLGSLTHILSRIQRETFYIRSSIFGVFLHYKPLLLVFCQELCILKNFETPLLAIVK